MGNSGKWLKSLITLKKSASLDHEKQIENKGKKKWRLWRSSSEGLITPPSSSSKGLKRVNVVMGSEHSDASLVFDDAFVAAMATVARAPPRDFMVVKQEWAAIRIQTAFRGLLARRALRALRAVVRLQAIFRGRQVRKQAAVTLKCMQALVRVQARVRAHNVRMSSEGQSMQKLLDECRSPADPTKQAEEGWCDYPGTVDEVRAKLQMRQEGAIKRERAIAYALSQRQSRSCCSPARRTNKSAMPPNHQKLGNNSPGWSWLERWMAAKPWENRLMEEVHPDSLETPLSRKSEDNMAGFYSYSSSKSDSIKVRRNNVTTKVLARPPSPMAGPITRSSSAPSSDSPHEESSLSTSSTSFSPIPFSNNTNTPGIDRVEESYIQKFPSYMNLTESIKAKQKAFRFSPSPHYAHKHVEDQFEMKSMPLSSSIGDTKNKNSVGSNPSLNLSGDLYPPIPLGRHDEIRRRRK